MFQLNLIIRAPGLFMEINTFRTEYGLAFDFEGPIVDFDQDGHHPAHLECARRVGLNLTIEEAIRQIPHFLGGPDEAVAQDIFELGNKSMTAEEIFKLDSELFNSWLMNQDPLPIRDGICDFLDKLLDKRIKITIGSALKKDVLHSCVKRAGLSLYFPTNAIIAGEDVASKTKPEPDIYLETARRMKINPQNQIVFEDSPRGITAGVAAGAYVIGMPVYYTPEVIQKLKEAGAQEIYSGWNKVDLIAHLKLVSSGF